MSPITTHVLDTRLGRPAANIEVTLERLETDGERREIARGTTDSDGRITDLVTDGIMPGRYAIRFATGSYFAAQQVETFYPWVEIVFTIGDVTHHHVPLLLSPFGYTTYRGS